MPPSPSMRCSAGRELRMENHRRGRSFESGLPVKVKDDDLALFNDMQMRERDNFLLCSNDDFDDSLLKLKHFSDFKLNIPLRGESSDLLNVGGEKNDYDWLLTPPDTPLFPSLDEEEPTPVNLVPRGRPRTQPIMISTSPMMEKSRRSSRSSASPHRLSPSPRSARSLPQSRGRPSSAPNSSPAPVLRPTTPSRRPSTPPNKPSTPTARSSTPTLRRMSTGLGGNISSSAIRGASPVKASRGNSASPKLGGWQSNLPGFSSEPPPNLRTSPSDWPASYARGSSPASRNGRDSSLRSRRQSMSPTASRSASSSHSNDRDHFSSHSKGSVASSCDDEVDFPHSVNVGISASPTLRKNGVSVNNRTMTLSKKPSRTVSSSSAPKRSFDSVLRQMDQRKTPQNMFRPLLSSVPASTFYIGKSNTMHRPLFSRNSSLTTSSNASSELGASIAPETEGSEHDQNDLAAEWEKMPDAEAQEEIFAFDKVDGIEEVEHSVCAEKSPDTDGDLGDSTKRNIKSEELEQLTSDLVDVKVTLPSTEFLYAAGGYSEVESITMMGICSKCNKNFRIFETIDGKVDVCQECAQKDGYIADGIHSSGLLDTMGLISQDMHVHPNMAVVGDESHEKSHVGGNVSRVSEFNNESLIIQPQRSLETLPGCLPNVCPIELDTGERAPQLFDKEPDHHHEVVSTSSDKVGKFQRFHSFSSCQNSRIDGPEGAGISVLLKRSYSGKGPVVQGRSLSPASIFCAEPPYLKGIMTRDSSSASSSVNMGSSRHIEGGIQRQLSSSSADMGLASEPGLKCQVDHVNVSKVYLMPERFSATSSIDSGSSRQTEAHIQRQLSGSKSGESLRTQLNSKCKINEMFLPGVSNNSQEDLAASMTRSEEMLGNSGKSMHCDNHGESLLVTEEHAEPQDNTQHGDAHSSSTGGIVPTEYESIHSENCGEMDTSLCESVSDTHSPLLEDVSADKHFVSSVNAEDHLSQNMISGSEEHMPAEILDSFLNEEDEIMNDSPCRTDISGVLLQSSSGAVLGLEDDCDSLKCSQTENEASQSSNNFIDSSQAHPVSQTSEKDVLVSGLESDNTDHAHGESTIKVEGPGGNKSESLTLEEATDTILFCSSIINDLAFKAAAIAIEKEHPPPTEETWRPTVTLLGKSTFDEKDQRRLPSKRMPKPQKAKRKRLEMDAMIPVAEAGNSAKNHDVSVLNAELPNKADSTKPPKLESKCNCTVM